MIKCRLQCPCTAQPAHAIDSQSLKEKAKRERSWKRAHLVQFSREIQDLLRLEVIKSKPGLQVRLHLLGGPQQAAQGQAAPRLCKAAGGTGHFLSTVQRTAPSLSEGKQRATQCYWVSQVGEANPGWPWCGRVGRAPAPGGNDCGSLRFCASSKLQRSQNSGKKGKQSHQPRSRCNTVRSV